MNRRHTVYLGRPDGEEEDWPFATIYYIWRLRIKKAAKLSYPLLSLGVAVALRFSFETGRPGK